MKIKWELGSWPFGAQAAPRLVLGPYLVEYLGLQLYQSAFLRGPRGVFPKWPFALPVICWQLTGQGKASWALRNPEGRLEAIQVAQNTLPEVHRAHSPFPFSCLARTTFCH